MLEKENISRDLIQNGPAATPEPRCVPGGCSSEVLRVGVSKKCDLGIIGTMNSTMMPMARRPTWNEALENQIVGRLNPQ